MVSRLAACNPCRASKLACNHARPTCERCLKDNKAEQCTYRVRPFSRKEQRANRAAIPSRTTSSTSNGIERIPTAASNHAVDPISSGYTVSPNPGYLGESSHAAIFRRLKSRASSPQPTTETTELSTSSTAESSTPGSSREVVQYGVKIIEQIRASTDIEAMVKLVSAWLSKGLNFSLASSVMGICVSSAAEFCQRCKGNALPDSLSAALVRNTRLRFSYSANTTIEDYCAQLCGDNTRWETLGFFFTAVCRAAVDLVSLPGVYETESRRRELRAVASGLADRCLELSLALDCLNDVQLILQYENWIVHSHVDGDQSYHAWRKLGDLISSVLALGHHEQGPLQAQTPPFLTDLRRATFAEVYTSDKDVSIFLGRAPRISKRFCNVQVPHSIPGGLMAGANHIDGVFTWHPDTKPGMRAEICWGALCALLKEDILELFRGQDRSQQAERINAIRTKALQQWEELPPNLRLQGSLRNFDGTAIQRGFLAAIRLNYLFVLFLLHLVSHNRSVEPDQALLEIAQEILSLIIETVVMRDRVVNTGSGLVWKVACYGLPAAGILCLSILQQRTQSSFRSQIAADVVRNLGTLVTEVELGAVVQLGDANYTLLSQATHTIRTMLDMTISGTLASENVLQRDPGAPAGGIGPLQPNMTEEMQWAPWNNVNLWEFEIDSWNNLTDHLSLLGEGRQFADNRF